MRYIYIYTYMFLWDLGISQISDVKRYYHAGSDCARKEQSGMAIIYILNKLALWLFSAVCAVPVPTENCSYRCYLRGVTYVPRTGVVCTRKLTIITYINSDIIRYQSRCHQVPHHPNFLFNMHPGLNHYWVPHHISFYNDFFHFSWYCFVFHIITHI